MLLGFLAVAGAFAVFVYATSRTEEAVRFKKVACFEFTH